MSERCKENRAMPALEKRRDSKLREFASKFEFSFAVAEDLGALQQDPKIALCVGGESLNGADGKCGRSSLRKSTEVEAIEANQTFFCSNPQVAVERLSQRGDGAASEALVAAPALAHVLSQGKIGIKRMGKGCRKRQCTRGDQHVGEKAPASTRFKGD